MNKPITTYLATTNPVEIAEGGRHHGRMGRYAVIDQGAAGPVAFREIQDELTGEWVRQSGGSVCQLLVSAVMQASMFVVMPSVSR